VLLHPFFVDGKLFTGGEDLTQLALETRYVIGGAGDAPNKFRVIVLRGDWLAGLARLRAHQFDRTPRQATRPGRFH
jgi:hypothetical protein